MTTTTGKTPLQKLPYPTLSNPAHPDNQKELADYLDDRIVMRFTNEAQRNSTVTAPVAGMTAYLSESKAVTMYDGSKWTSRPLDPPRAHLYSTQDVTTGPKEPRTFPFDAVKYASDPSMKAGWGLKIPVSGLYIVTAWSLITDPITPAGVYREMIPLIAKQPAGARAAVGQIAPYHTPFSATWHIECAAGELIEIQVSTDDKYGRFTGGSITVAWVAPLVGATPVR